MDEVVLACSGGLDTFHPPLPGGGSFDSARRQIAAMRERIGGGAR
jgi:hypothetical protein